MALKIDPAENAIVKWDKGRKTYRLVGLDRAQEYTLRAAIPNLPADATRTVPWELGYMLEGMIRFWRKEYGRRVRRGRRTPWFAEIPEVEFLVVDPLQRAMLFTKFAVEVGKRAKARLEWLADGSPITPRSFGTIRKALQDSRPRGFNNAGRVNPYTGEECAAAISTTERRVSVKRIRAWDGEADMPLWAAIALAKYFSEHSGVGYTWRDFYKPPPKTARRTRKPPVGAGTDTFAQSPSEVGDAPDESEYLLTAREVAAQLEVSPRWVTVHASGKHRPLIPSIKMGRFFRFRQPDINAFIAYCRQQMAAGLPLHGPPLPQ